LKTRFAVPLTFTDFPIARVDDRGKVQAWQTDIRGLQELVVSGASVLVFGGYGEHSTDCALLKLGNGRAE
jgi:hypothetical protein